MNYTHTNSLSHENSPYLLQHAHNPVNWYPWGPEALAKAKKENKVLLISIGYAACHWCHVMERESFENEEVAKVMNEFFVCIKVDREERPDIDQIYMDAVQMMTGSGGWPLNCFAMPDGKPFFGGTYFPAGNWVNVLKGIQNAWVNETDKVQQVANQLAMGIRENEIITVKAEASSFPVADLEKAYRNWKQDFDSREGGNNRVPKFPLPNSLQFLLRYYYFTKDQSALNQVTLTLDKMAMGGIYDQVGGGFARYSVDAIWKVPHFEKMLYDNAQLISLYAEAYQLTKIPEYKQVIQQTLEFVNRELSLPQAGFYSSLDADSEGVEGKFYVWEKSEVDALLKEDSELFCEFYGITNPANWEEGNILMIQTDKKSLAKKYKISVKQLELKLERDRRFLLHKRTKRIRPALDDKALTSWNALMLKGYVDAYKALGDQNYLNRAIQNAEFMQQHLWKGKAHLHRNYKDGNSKINAFLDDYSFTIEAFVALYQASFNEEWLLKANDLLEQVLLHFSDEKSGMFFYTSNEDDALIARKMELVDNVIPSSNSSIAKSLFLVGTYLDKTQYIERSKQMLANIKPRFEKTISYHSNWGQVYFWLANPPVEIVIMGEDAVNQKRKIEELFLPNILISGSTSESNLPLLQNRYVNGQTTFYLCINQSCKLPVTNVNDLLNQLEIALRK
ncbi:thioredoxin domain-containing protein [Labilibaculum filiforme]|uniref:Thioredoxin domain-containing protein n=2 Tax=Labilibaculum filiforme TaxID=1940526 RepID=A0A2N3HUN4_9BACT|nr:thioredoxin domain-containing protein [Labilibaculum filiforme]